MKKRLYKFYKSDFTPLPVNVLHIDLDFDMYQDHTVVQSQMHLKSVKPLRTLELNADDLEIIDITCKHNTCTYTYDKKRKIITIIFKKQFRKNIAFTLETKTICRPTDNILEGLYYDVTPSACPKTQITQCQQWGFQRIVPCFDDMRAKCTYNTKITADNRYTNMISNGDPSKVTKVTSKRSSISYDNTVTPMAPYLFFLGVGTYATFKRELEYPDGSSFQLELLVPPKSEKKRAEHALHVLHDAILWVYVFTGRDTKKQMLVRQQIKELIDQREQAKKSKNQRKLSQLRSKLKTLNKKIHPGYKYTGKVYREIGMQNSDFGGMENVGNTTITTNRIMPFKDMGDPSYEYMIRVKAHEYYHNLNGSEVTGDTPFSLWLNEAVTVHIEREYHEYLFGKDYVRLSEVLHLHAPGTGTFAQDNGPGSMPVEPDGFNSPNELITGMTYVKAPEFVRMIQILLGDDKFYKALNHYHTSFSHGNASPDDWIASMEKFYGKPLKSMARSWLKQTGYPIVQIKKSYDASKKQLKLTLSHKAKGKYVWQFPIDIAAMSNQGKVLKSLVHVMTKKQETIILKNISKPAYISVNRGGSFYGKTLERYDKDQLLTQVRTDPDVVNRYLAFSKLLDHQKTALLCAGEVDEDLVDLYYELLSDKELMSRIGPSMLVIFEYSPDPAFTHQYDKLYEVKKQFLTHVAKKYTKQLRTLYSKYQDLSLKTSTVDRKPQDILARQVKNTCLSLLSLLDTKDVHQLIKKQLKSPHASDLFAAFKLYLDSSAKDKYTVMKTFEQSCKGNLVRWEAYLATVARSEAKDGIDLIKKVEKSPLFTISQSNDQRALFMQFVFDRKRSLLTTKGRSMLKSILLKLAPINDYNTSLMLKVFSTIPHLEKKHQGPLREILQEVASRVDPHKAPSVSHTAKRMLVETAR